MVHTAGWRQGLQLKITAGPGTTMPRDPRRAGRTKRIRNAARTAVARKSRS